MSLYICHKIINTAFRMPTMVSCEKLHSQYHRRLYRHCVRISVFVKNTFGTKMYFVKTHIKTWHCISTVEMQCQAIFTYRLISQALFFIMPL